MVAIVQVELSSERLAHDLERHFENTFVAEVDIERAEIDRPRNDTSREGRATAIEAIRHLHRAGGEQLTRRLPALLRERGRRHLTAVDRQIRIETRAGR